MTMARIKEKGDVAEVGIPRRLKSSPIEELYRDGWRQVKGTPKPERTSDELMWVYGSPYTYNTEDDAVYGTWIEKPIPEIRLKEKRESASLSRADFKLGLLGMGELDAVKAAMADPEADQRAVILWEDASEFRRTDENLLRLASDLGYTEAELDEIFGIGA